jgi:hypothetical protein
LPNGNTIINKDADFISLKELAEILDCVPDEVIRLDCTGKSRATKQVWFSYLSSDWLLTVLPAHQLFWVIL